MSTKPNAHDFQQLAIIYQHLDSFSTVAAMSAMTASSSEVDVDHDRPETWGRLVRQGHHGRSSLYERHNRDGSLTVTHVFWTQEAVEDCAACDHRHDNRFNH